MRVGLVTTNLEVLQDRDGDMLLIVDALAKVNVEAVPSVWHDPQVDWSAFDLLVMRSPWDYSQRYAEFNAWLESVGQNNVILNCPHVIRWNSDKVYLQDLSNAGVSVVPTVFARGTDELARAIAATGKSEVVIKPSVSAGSKDTGRFEVADEAAIALGQRILEQGKTVMVQPSITSVATAGERALLYFDGSFSHAASKGPILDLGGGLVGGEYVEAIRAVVPEPGELEVAAAASKAISTILDRGCDCATGGPLYARFDVVRADHGYQLLEAELFEPSYFLWTATGAADRFASAVARRLGMRRG